MQAGPATPHQQRAREQQSRPPGARESPPCYGNAPAVRRSAFACGFGETRPLPVDSRERWRDYWRSVDGWAGLRTEERPDGFEKAQSTGIFEEWRCPGWTDGGRDSPGVRSVVNG